MELAIRVLRIQLRYNSSVVKYKTLYAQLESIRNKGRKTTVKTIKNDLLNSIESTDDSCSYTIILDCLDISCNLEQSRCWFCTQIMHSVRPCSGFTVGRIHKDTRAYGYTYTYTYYEIVLHIKLHA